MQRVKLYTQRCGEVFRGRIKNPLRSSRKGFYIVSLKILHILQRANPLILSPFLFFSLFLPLPVPFLSLASPFYFLALPWHWAAFHDIASWQKKWRDLLFLSLSSSSFLLISSFFFLLFFSLPFRENMMKIIDKN